MPERLRRMREAPDQNREIGELSLLVSDERRHHAGRAAKLLPDREFRLSACQEYLTE